MYCPKKECGSRGDADQIKPQPPHIETAIRSFLRDDDRRFERMVALLSLQLPTRMVLGFAAFGDFPV